MGRPSRIGQAKAENENRFNNNLCMGHSNDFICKKNLVTKLKANRLCSLKQGERLLHYKK